MTENNKLKNPSGSNRNWIRGLVFGGLLIAIGIILPMLFHAPGGQAAGKTFLPMHIPVLIGGLLLGPFYGAAIGAITPFINSVATGMPPPAVMPFMVVELGVYGMVAGFFYHTLKLNRFRFPLSLKEGKAPGKEVTNTERFFGLYTSLILAMIAGRAVYAMALLVANRLFGMEKADPASVPIAIATGIIGIIIQLVIIPPIIFALQKGGISNGSFTRSRPKTK